MAETTELMEETGERLVAKITAAKVPSPASVSISDADRIGPASVHERVRKTTELPVFEQPPEDSTMPSLVEAYRNLLAMYKVSAIIRNNAAIIVQKCTF